MRMIAEEMRNDTKPLRLSYYGQCYRYEEFKKGRYREFFQYGVELIGASVATGRSRSNCTSNLYVRRLWVERLANPYWPCWNP